MTASVLQEFGALHLSRPTADVPDEAVAAWHKRRAVVLDHLADEGNPTHDLAVSARRHALDLLAGH